MDSKEKIELLKKYLQDSKNIILPSELRAEVSIQANTIGIGGDMGGALTCLRELQREEGDKKIIKIQEQQSKILEQQTIFTKVLAIATLILAIGTIFQAISYFIFNRGGVSDTLTYIFVGGFTLLIAIAIILLKDTKWK